MNRIALYEAACAKLGADAAVLQLGDRFIIGRWVKLSVNHKNVILPCARWMRGIEVIGEGASWPEAAHAADLTLVAEVSEAAQ